MITTTFYNLIAVLQDDMGADNDEQVVDAVYQLMAASRIKLQPDWRCRKQDIGIPIVATVAIE